MNKLFLFVFASVLLISCAEKVEDSTEKKDELYQEKFRPQFHFSPPTGWMNDPNGLVYNDGVYHLFYQYYPNATVWGPMHWGHAVSEDLVHWQHKPIALYPDENGLIFSGSAVVDKYNTSGFGNDTAAPLVAIYTYHLMEGEKAGRNDFQTQGIAFSLDNGDTWTKYEGNPVIENNGIRDLRDPKVFWHEATESWIMALVAGDHVKFYRSKNLKEWDNISDFGKEQGAHGGVWECPDLFPLIVEETGEEKWVLIISIGSGGPNGGSGTQYFVGDFDGTTFTSDQESYMWLDWGTDNYAGVTYNDTPNGERIFVGWMSNWQYATVTPTETWRSAMTTPRTLSLKKQGEDYFLTNYPVETIFGLSEENNSPESLSLAPDAVKTIDFETLGQSSIEFTVDNEDFVLNLTNDKGEHVTIIYDKISKLIMVDRTQSGIINFHPEFGNKLHYMLVGLLQEDTFDVTILIDKSSIELFINDGQYVMTEQIFPTKDYDKLIFENTSGQTITISELSVQQMKSIWK